MENTNLGFREFFRFLKRGENVDPLSLANLVKVQREVEDRRIEFRLGFELCTLCFALTFNQYTSSRPLSPSFASWYDS